MIKQQHDPTISTKRNGHRPVRLVEHVPSHLTPGHEPCLPKPASDPARHIRPGPRRERNRGRAILSKGNLGRRDVISPAIERHRPQPARLTNRTRAQPGEQPQSDHSTQSQPDPQTTHPSQPQRSSKQRATA
jgi:hypothetical protein